MGLKNILLSSALALGATSPSLYAQEGVIQQIYDNLTIRENIKETNPFLGEVYKMALSGASRNGDPSTNFLNYFINASREKGSITFILGIPNGLVRTGKNIQASFQWHTYKFDSDANGVIDDSPEFCSLVHSSREQAEKVMPILRNQNPVWKGEPCGKYILNQNKAALLEAISSYGVI